MYLNERRRGKAGMNVKDTIRLLKSEKASALMAELYGREGAAENETRYEKMCIRDR